MTADFIAGIAASEGIAIAPVYLLTEPDLSFEAKQVEDTDTELQRLEDAIEEAIVEINQIKDQAEASMGVDEAQVFEAHLMFLADPEFIGQMKTKIQNEASNAEQALHEVSQVFVQMFESMDDNPYMQERAADIKDVSERVLAKLLKVNLPNLSTIDSEVILVAQDLTPSDTAQLNREYVLGFATDIGGRTSHSAIMARTLEIPAVVGTQTITQAVNDGDMIILDAIEGKVFYNPSQELLEEYQEKLANFDQEQAELLTLVDKVSETQDGHQVEIAANIGTPQDIENVLKSGAEGIGLYRTEFLYMDSKELPSEEDQYQAYYQVLEKMGDKPVVVRTMDIGGDKKLPYLPLPEEMNPFLGYRAIRISLDRVDIFKTQLRALLRASVAGNLRIMFPMIASLVEFRQAKAILDEVKEELIQADIPVSENIQVGIMVEIPAAAVLADQFAKEVDFFSIGTNDLIQYTMAADRMNERVSYLYQPFNPSVLRLIKFVIDAAHQEGKWVGMCGEMAGEPLAAPILLGMGLDEFSMSASSVLRSRGIIRKLNYSEMKELADQALNKCVSAEEVEELVRHIK